MRYLAIKSRMSSHNDNLQIATKTEETRYSDKKLLTQPSLPKEVRQRFSAENKRILREAIK